MKFTIERLVLVRMLKAVARRAPLRGRPEKMVRLSACGARVFVEANRKAAGTEALVLAEGACLLHRDYILYLLIAPRRHTSPHAARPPAESSVRSGAREPAA